MFYVTKVETISENRTMKYGNIYLSFSLNVKECYNSPLRFMNPVLFVLYGKET